LKWFHFDVSSGFILHRALGARFTSKVVIAALWKREQIDLAELARLRWVERWKYERLANHFGIGRTTVRDLIRQIKATPSLSGLSAKPTVIRSG